MVTSYNLDPYQIMDQIKDVRITSQVLFVFCE